MTDRNLTFSNEQYFFFTHNFNLTLTNAYDYLSFEVNYHYHTVLQPSRKIGHHMSHHNYRPLQPLLISDCLLIPSVHFDGFGSIQYIRNFRYHHKKISMVLKSEELWSRGVPPKTWNYPPENMRMLNRLKNELRIHSDYLKILGSSLIPWPPMNLDNFVGNVMNTFL